MYGCSWDHGFICRRFLLFLSVWGEFLKTLVRFMSAGSLLVFLSFPNGLCLVLSPHIQRVLVGQITLLSKFYDFLRRKLNLLYFVL